MRRVTAARRAGEIVKCGICGTGSRGKGQKISAAHRVEAFRVRRQPLHELREDVQFLRAGAGGKIQGRPLLHVRGLGARRLPASVPERAVPGRLERGCAVAQSSPHALHHVHVVCVAAR